MSALSYLQWWGGRALLIGETGNGKKEKKRDGKGEEKRGKQKGRVWIRNCSIYTGYA